MQAFHNAYSEGDDDGNEESINTDYPLSTVDLSDKLETTNLFLINPNNQRNRRRPTNKPIVFLQFIEAMEMT